MKKAYLTIDDAPSEDFLKKANYLYKRNIPVVFFCIGEKIEKHFDQLVSAIKMGFIIGNHSFSHNYFSNLSIDECIQEIQKTDQLIDSLYEKAGINRTHKYFRFPHFDAGGHSSGAEYEAQWNLPKDQWNQYPLKEKKEEIQEYFGQLQYELPHFKGINEKYFSEDSPLTGLDVKCTFDQAEYFLGNENAPWGLSEEDAIIARIDEDFPYEGRSLNCFETSDIILVHDHEYTTNLFYRIIDRYIEKGISFQSFQ